MYEGFTIGNFAKFLDGFIYDLVEGLGHYSLPSKFLMGFVGFKSVCLVKLRHPFLIELKIFVGIILGTHKFSIRVSQGPRIAKEK